VFRRPALSGPLAALMAARTGRLRGCDLAVPERIWTSDLFLISSGQRQGCGRARWAESWPSPIRA